MNEILIEVGEYYSDKLAQHGETPNGVDWNSLDSQWLRFDQLTKIIRNKREFSLNDLGCGYGALLDYLNPRYPNFSYSGCDVSANMIQAAKNRYASNQNALFYESSMPPNIAEYTIASGIFNVRLGRSDAEWQQHIKATLDVLNKHSRHGFAFNCLTSYSDAEKMRNDLYYANPCEIFDLCKRRYSFNVALLHDYGLYEFTILVRKQVGNV